MSNQFFCKDQKPGNKLKQTETNKVNKLRKTNTTCRYSPTKAFDRSYKSYGRRRSATLRCGIEQASHPSQAPPRNEIGIGLNIY
jgi:hypothetical protein